MVTPPLPPLSDDTDFNAPLGTARADALIDSLGDLEGAAVLDLGCGWGELLLRVLERWPTATGLGVDTDEAAIGQAVRRAAERGLGDRVRFEVHDVAAWGGSEPAYDAVLVVGASHAWGGSPAESPRLALGGIRGLLSPGRRAVYGEGFWSRTPTSEQLAAMPITLEELGSLADLVDTATAAGFALHALSQATLDEWDDFESRHARGYQRWLAEHPDAPDAAQVRRQDDEHRRAWLHGWRETMGFAYLTLTR